MPAWKPAKAFPASRCLRRVVCAPTSVSGPDLLVGAGAGPHDGKRLAGLRRSRRAGFGLCRLGWFAVAAFLFVFAGAGVAWGQGAAEYGGATASMGAVGTGVRPTDVLTSPSGAPTNDITLPMRSGPPPEVVNRQALEKQAGKVAAKLLLRSLPSNARVWIDGKFVGRAPLLLLVPPGAHRVQMLGDRQEHASEQVSLLAHEARDMELHLAERYPATISLTGLQ